MQQYIYVDKSMFVVVVILLMNVTMQMNAVGVDYPCWDRRISINLLIEFRDVPIAIFEYSA